jgi:regulatory protein
MKMIITAKKGKGNKLHIHIDDAYLLTVTADFWFSGSFRQEDEINDEELKEFTEKACASRAYNKALDLVSRRDHSQKELENKLARTSSREAAKFAAQKAVDAGLVNDEIYARKLADELFRRKGMSPSHIRMELIHKGISTEIADNTAESIDFEPQECIIELLKTKFCNKLADEKDKARTFNALIRLGYSYTDIRAALRAIDMELDDE